MTYHLISPARMQKIKAGQVQKMLDELNSEDETPVIVIALGPGESDEELDASFVDELSFYEVIRIMTAALSSIVSNHGDVLK